MRKEKKVGKNLTNWLANDTDDLDYLILSDISADCLKLIM